MQKNENRYEVGLPWKAETVPKSTGYNMCVKRLRQLQSRLKKDKTLFQDYDNIIREQESSGIVEQTNDTENNGYFLPHHGVIRQDKETSKLRIAFDGSAKPSEDDFSLNDCLEKGPNSVPLLFDIIVRFREYPIGLTADIEKAFHQVQIAPQDREMIKCLWFDDITKENPEIKHYQFRRLPFGLKPSPGNGGFTLRKWNTNSKELREKIESEKTASTSGSTASSETAPPIKQTNCNNTVSTENISSQSTDLEPEMPISDKHCHAKILGLNWNVHTDELQCDTTELLAYAKSLPTTKRSVLKLSAKVFDPLRLLSPFTINMKILFQILCNNNIDWDDPLDGEILTHWTGILNNLSSLMEVKVPRCYFHFTGKILHHEIHGFSDASERAYAAVVYLKTEHANGNIDVKLIAAKTRVAPLSKQSIPRLELLGALTVSWHDWSSQYCKLFNP